MSSYPQQPSPPQGAPQQQQQQYFPPPGQQQQPQQQWNPQAQVPYPPQQHQQQPPYQQQQPPYQQQQQPPYQQQQQPPYQQQSPYPPQAPYPPPPQGTTPQGTPQPQQQQQPPAPGGERALVAAPAGHGFGLFPQLIPQVPETLVLKEKFSFSGDDFDIHLLSGVPVFKVKGSVMSLSGRKSVFDLRSGQHLFDIQKEHFHIHTTFALNSPNGRKLGQVKSGFALIGSKATCTIYPENGPPRALKMKGGWLDLDAKIVDGQSGQVAAVIQRRLGAQDLLFGRQTYHVAVTPGYDLSVVAAMCICLDEKNNEGGGVLF